MDERLNGLREKVAKKARLEALLPELEKQKSMLESAVCELERELERENADVEKLEKTTLSSLLARAMGKLDGKIAVVTGANSGMGMATTAALSDMGAAVIMLCRNRQRGMEALEKLLEKPDRKLELILCDLEDFTSIGRFADTVMDKYEKIDCRLISEPLKGFERKQRVSFRRLWVRDF